MRRFIAWIPACLFLAACTVSPYQHEVNSTCGQYLPLPGGCFGDGCGAIVLIELPFVGLCEGVYFLQHQLTPAPARNIHDGIYKAPSGSFSVQVPDDQPPVTYKGQQASIHGLSYVSFMPTLASLPAYTVAVMAYHPSSSKGGEPWESAMPGHMGGSVLGVSYSAFGEVKRIRDPLPTTVDGEDARLGVYGEFNNNSEVSAYYLVYSLRRTDAQATISVSWSGPCPRCRDGTEEDILAGVPGAERFLKSFHVMAPETEAAP
ncbi:MAG TPA: hypothetical protein VGM16_04360 [Gammaproteobacteria bacterium]|jgi:hypothetical protein